MNNKMVLLVAALPFFCATSALGDALTLREAIGRALESNHLLRAAALEHGAAQQELAASRSRYFPRLRLESGAVVSNTPSSVFMMKLDEARIDPESDFAKNSLNHPEARADFRNSLTLEQPLLDAAIASGAQLAEKEAEAAALSLQKSREQVAFRVYLAYLAVRKCQAFREIADQALCDAREHDRLAAVREKDGVGLKSDRLRVVTALREAEQGLLSAENDLLLARMRLNLAVGGAQGGTLDIGGSAELREPALRQEELLSQALGGRAELRMAQKAVEKGDIAVRQAADAYLPTIQARADYQLNDRDLPFAVDNSSWSVGLQLRWELLDGGSRSHLRQKAELKRQAAAETLDQQRREVALLVTESLLRRQEAGLKLASARAALEAAREGSRLVTLRFGNGLASMVELMDAETVLNRSRASLVEVENGFLGSTGEIYYQAGLFLKEVMQ